MYVLFMCASLGMRTATAASIGKQIGTGDIQKAKQYYQAHKQLSLMVTGVITVLCFILWGPIIGLYTDSS